jgi:tRNA-2-methylthio-N6-dimethylallyladenosine synthase
MKKKKILYIETYGCQMNFSDSEVVASILKQDYQLTTNIKDADLILINTCSIRDNAEKRVENRLHSIKHLKKNNQHLKIGIIGCMAERMKESLFEKGFDVDLVFGPDAYRELPKQLEIVHEGRKSINTILSEKETYDNINPVRINSNGISAYISIMRGCENFCSYCVVPYTRGKERSRNPDTILSEAEKLVLSGYKEITVLGQNVNSYNWKEYNFPRLIDELAQIDNQLRIRFATSHPKDLSDELIDVIKNRKNICRSIHLPVQSGSNDILKRMNRKYSTEWYLDRVKSIKKHIKDCTISTDIISGFCGETEKDHQDTLSLMEKVGYYYAFMFKYSDRPGTKAHKSMKDDVPEKVKSRRLDEIIELQQKLSLESNKKDIGKEFEVLVEGESKRSQDDFFGRNSQNKVIVFPATKGIITGRYTNKVITKVTAATLIGK